MNWWFNKKRITHILVAMWFFILPCWIGFCLCQVRIVQCPGSAVWVGSRLFQLSLRIFPFSPSWRLSPMKTFHGLCGTSSSARWSPRPRSCSWGRGLCALMTSPPSRGIARGQSSHLLCSCRLNLPSNIYHSAQSEDKEKEWTKFLLLKKILSHTWRIC